MDKGTNGSSEITLEEIMLEHERTLNNTYGVGCWHCDDLWAKKTQPECVQKFLDIKRAPAIEQFGKEDPILFADYNGKRVRVTMASRFGDVGITASLDAKRGYEDRVYIPELSNFSSIV